MENNLSKRAIAFLFLLFTWTPSESSAQVPEIQSCYGGATGIPGIGICRAGTRERTETGWTPCRGQVLPSPEIVGNMIDEDCDGSLLTSVVGYDPRSDFAPTRPTVGLIRGYETRSFGYWRVATWYRPLIVPFTIAAVIIFLLCWYTALRTYRIHDWILIHVPGAYLPGFIMGLSRMLSGAVVGSIAYTVGRMLWNAGTGISLPLDGWLFLTLLCANINGIEYLYRQMVVEMDSRSLLDDKSDSQQHRPEPSSSESKSPREED